MKKISYENLEYNHIYYINNNGTKYTGIFTPFLIENAD